MSYLDTHGLTTLWNKIKSYVSNYHDTTKQNTLVSGTNIKTVNGQSLLGSGDATISSTSTVVTTSDTSSISLVNNQTIVATNTLTDAGTASVTLNFATPTSGINYDCNFIFKAGSTFSGFIYSIDNNYAVVWEGGEPTYTANTIYEVSFRCLWFTNSSDKIIILARCGEYNVQ